MKAKKIKKYNKLIAKYLGWKKNRPINGLWQNKENKVMFYLEFHKSWLFLMMAIEAITKDMVNSGNYNWTIGDTFAMLEEDFIFSVNRNEIQSYFKAVVNYIKSINLESTAK